MRVAAHRPALAMALAFVCALALAAPAMARQPMPSVLDLYRAIPPPPATPHEAATWFDANGTLAHPGLTALKQQIATHRRGLESHHYTAPIAGTVTPSHDARPSISVGECADVQAAVAAAERVIVEDGERASIRTTLWQTNDAAIAKVSGVIDAPLARDGAVLTLRRSAFALARENAEPLVRDANTHLVATTYGDRACGQHTKRLIQTLDVAALGEIESLVTKLEDLVTSAAATVRAEQAKTRAVASRQ